MSQGYTLNNNIESTYEKMYAYEEEIKNNISIKTQLIFTAIFALVSITAYLARFLDFAVKPDIAYAISFLVVLVISISVVSAYFNCKAFSGSEFNRMPYSQEVKQYCDDQVNYNVELTKYNSQVDPHEQIAFVDPVKETEDFISNTYVQCSTHNALINEKRSRWVFKSVSAFLIACIPLAMASILFVVFDMDTSSPRKNFSIKDSYVGGEIASLKNQISTSHKNDQIADLEKRTIILESLLLAERAEKLSESKKATASEQKPKPEAPVKPRTPPARVSMDEAPPRSQK